MPPLNCRRGRAANQKPKIQAALENAMAGPHSKLRKRMIPFLTLGVASAQAQHPAVERSLAGHFVRGQSKEQVDSAIQLADTCALFRKPNEAPLKQPAGTFDPGQPGGHLEQSQFPRFLGIQPAFTCKPARTSGRRCNGGHTCNRFVSEL
jgi:hypothetical protein